MFHYNNLEIINHPLHQIEYSIIDSCNKNCKSCSHFAPLAKRKNAIGEEEFKTNTERLHRLIPDVHSFWLIGGEPTLHPNYLKLLKILRNIYNDIPVGIMSNGYGVLAKRNDEYFWEFIRENKIVWRITTYDVSPEIYLDLFQKNGCEDLLSLVINNQFLNIAVLTERPQEITKAKYNICGWERLNIFVRNNRIWKCPIVEYIDLFNCYFQKNFTISKDDYLNIDNLLTRKKIIEFNDCPSSFCRYCDMAQRHKKTFTVTSSEKKITEWMDVNGNIDYHSVL